MNTKIIGFAGAKQAGKTTCANFLHGCQLKSHGIVKDFSVLEDGNLVVETEVVDPQGVETFGSSVLDVSRNDLEFTEWALFSMWPFVKKYSFADTLKQIATELFKIPRECVYGTNEQKNQLQEHLLWENMPGVVTDDNADIFSDVAEASLLPDEYPSDYSKLTHHKPGPMTAREFLQFLGTDIMRKMYEPIWVERVIADIQSEKPLLAVVDDVRFLNEIEAIQNVGGKVIGLGRQPFESSHSSENVAEHVDSLDGYVEAEKNIHDMCQDTLDFMTDFGWLSDQVEAEPVSRLQGGIHSIKENK
tara:strand:- start:11223 stop:12131 length:909 start_codon:yes stop_codon:yes gene_type:complete